MTDFREECECPQRGFEPLDAPSANKPRAHPGRIEYDNQIGPGIIQELVVCLEDV
jgi:hypothetical protein